MGVLKKYSDLIELENKVSKFLDMENLNRILRDVVEQNGSKIYLDDDHFRRILMQYTQDIESELTITDVNRICLIVSLPIFKKLVTYKRQCVSRAEFCTFVNSTVEDTGLMKYVAYGIICAICYSLNWIDEMNSLKVSDIGNVNTYSKEIGIPYSIYKNEIKSLFDDNEVDYVETVKYYAQLGIPKAKYLLAKTMDCSKEETDGFKMMLSAANDGDSEACVYLGNYYYAKGKASWHRAYKYYTGYGYVILEQQERENVTNILNKRKKNKWMVIANWIFVAITLIVLICIPSFSIYRAQTVFGTIAILLEIALATYGVWNYRNFPFFDISLETCANFIIWIIFMLIRIGL